MNTAYLALGSNIEPRIDYLEQAINRLNTEDNIEVVRKSSIYETEPVGYTNQEQFLNMVVEVKTSKQPLELLETCQHIEKTLGRIREIKWGPRTVDLDILLYNQESIKMEQLEVPHPRMHERAFVLIPLAELHNRIVIPTRNKSVSEILEATSSQDKEGVVKWVQKLGEDE
ncbi:2-amino-4-hydroxy-6-hydroxymethyldihydropteridine diphosphokinase (plasmid) [Radiobacillus kanasensis]|uniref:2-amino-4-hydroxy-6- hydroxymethyldihydropteridine diphosphokinase n=1 Tax=Radiobacillus kanasensis TaxID=2844358 RepID=UPI001E51AE30|nr:2-amino-4-hydroxy-6-hydroxymethyldihydropteridine diphosphokinase [Radiobacillus kanasensis]UFU01496.1 2-amino-4-hydroxy-6-hydroxymethyldihydropteridine diphosphokinase [Radiobacillus kanasensis]